MKRKTSGHTATGFRLIRLCMAFVAVGLTARDTRATSEGIPLSTPSVKDEDFVARLNWFSSAGDAERERYVERMETEKKNLDAEGKAQLLLLKALSVEGKERWGKTVRRYGRIAHDFKTPPVYAATAAFRCVGLFDREGQTIKAINHAALARRSNPEGELWFETDAGWTNTSVRDVTRDAFDQLNGNRISYRFTRWLATLMPLRGAAGFIASLAVLCLVLRLLELPFFIRISGGRTTASHSLAWMFIDVVALIWAMRSLVTWWWFVFDLDYTPFLWLSRLTERSFVLTLIGVSCWFAYQMSLPGKTPRSTWFWFALWLFICYIQTAFFAVFLLCMGLSGLALHWAGRMAARYA